jgi:GNAT superfamily N-acetyltransferase
VCIRALRDLSRRQGKPPPHLLPPNFYPFFRHALATDPAGFHVAVEGRRVVAYAITILRGKTHFLAMFFALPGKQSLGTGRQLLARAFEDPRPPPGAARCVVASLDLRAQALYLKFGMYPRTIVYFVTGRPKAVGRPRIELRQVGPTGRPTKRALDLAARFDRPLREVRRDEDQRYIFTVVKGTRFFEARLDARTVGYVSIRGNGIIGPAGVSDARWSGDLLSAAIAKARELGVKKVSAWIPGLNDGALRAAFEAGLNIDFVTVWMAQRDLGNLRCYIPTGGVLF